MNRNRKISGDTASGKLKEQNKNLLLNNNELSRSVMNIRMMYEAVIGEKQALQQQHRNMQAMLTAILLQITAKKRNNDYVIKAKSLALIGKFAGIDIKQDGDDLVLGLVDVVYEAEAVDELA